MKLDPESMTISFFLNTQKYWSIIKKVIIAALNLSVILHDGVVTAHSSN